MFVYQMHILFLGLLGLSSPFPHRTPQAQPHLILPCFSCLHVLTGTPLHPKLHSPPFGLRSAVGVGGTTITTTKGPCSCRAALLSPFLANFSPASCTASPAPPPRPNQSGISGEQLNKAGNLEGEGTGHSKRISLRLQKTTCKNSTEGSRPCKRKITKETESLPS